MLSVDQARAVAEALLDKRIRPNFPHDVVIIEASIRENDEYWRFPYNGRAFVEHEDWQKAMAGNVPIAVNKHTGIGSFPEL